MSAPRLFTIPKIELEKLYFKDKLSMHKIADIYGCTHGTIVARFKELNLQSRGHLGLTPPVLISKEELQRLYSEENLSIKQIASMLGRSKGGVERKFRDYGLISRGENRKHWKYVKRSFYGSNDEKAYMIGFRLGDLNVYRRKTVIVVRGSTTKISQAKLIENMFSAYGGVHSSYAKRGTYEQYAFLDESFSFLVPKQDSIPDDILSCPRCFLSFFGGYIDAEGYVHIRKSSTNFGGFSVQTYDKNLLLQSKVVLESIGVLCRLGLGGREGYVSPQGVKSNKDSWRIDIYRKDSVWKFTHLMKSILRHADKTPVLDLIIENLISRNNGGKGYKRIDLSIPTLPSHTCQ